MAAMLALAAPKAPGAARHRPIGRGVHNVPHGALTGWLLGPVMEYSYLGEPHKFARIA
ncbi:MAG: hypothetical protein U0401_01415 [Anaerolineae bacterium]